MPRSSEFRIFEIYNTNISPEELRIYQDLKRMVKNVHELDRFLEKLYHMGYKEGEKEGYNQYECDRF